MPEVDYSLPAGIVMGEVREDQVGRYISLTVDPEGPLVHPDPAVRAADLLEYVDPEDVDAALRRGAKYMVEGVLDSPQLRSPVETDIEDWLNENRSWYSASFRPQLRQGLLDGRYFDMLNPLRDLDGDGIADAGSTDGDLSIVAWAPTTDTPRGAEIDLRVTRVSALPSHEYYPLIAIDYTGAWVRVVDVAERDPGFEALPFRTNYRVYLAEAGDTWVVHDVEFSWSRIGEASELPEPWRWLE
ncbi:MAG: hypothetical protein Q4G64_10560 [bacterium]|nr:hypothetical protein [bacterium]